MSSKGQVAWNKGKKFPHSPEWERRRLAAVREGIKRKPPLGGYHRPREHTQPMRLALLNLRKLNPEKYRALSIANLPKDCNGAKNGNWKGGITIKSRGIRWSMDYQRWRKTIISRDGKTCRICGTNRNVEAHHIIPISECGLIAFLPMNGVMLCRKHHYEHDTAWQGKRYKQMQLSGKATVLIFSIPHQFHTYPTVGNWQYTKDGIAIIFVSKLSDWRREMLVAVHELVEMLTCKHDGVTQQEVDNFDMQYEKSRKPGDASEAGDDVAAPYKFQHSLATGIERILAQQWGVTWKAYEDELEALP